MLRKLLALALLAMPGVAHAQWQEATSKHFIVYSQDEPDRLRTFTERLERFDKALRTLWGSEDRPVSPLSRVAIYVVDDIEDIQKLSGMRMAAGFMNPRASGTVAFVPRRGGGGLDSYWSLDSQAILLHEYGHHFMFSSWPSAVFPTWLVEGFAEFHATAMFRANGNIVLGAAPMYREWGRDKSNIYSADRLLQVEPGKISDEEREVLYARGWALTHYLLFDKERAKQLARRAEMPAMIWRS